MSRQPVESSEPPAPEAEALLETPAPESAETPATTPATPPPPPALLRAGLDDLGVRLGPDGGTLRVWSGAADQMELVVFDDTDLDWAIETTRMFPVGGGVWETTTESLTPGTLSLIHI